MKKNTQADIMTVPEMISFVHDVAHRHGNPESITAAKRVEIALTSIESDPNKAKSDPHTY